MLEVGDYVMRIRDRRLGKIVKERVKDKYSLVILQINQGFESSITRDGREIADISHVKIEKNKILKKYIDTKLKQL